MDFSHVFDPDMLYVSYARESQKKPRITLVMTLPGHLVFRALLIFLYM